MSGAPCKDCVSGFAHSGTPVGATSKIHGFNTYVSGPPAGSSPKGIVVIIPDAFGWEFVNTRVLADTYARKGSLVVYVPDFMNGLSCKESLLVTMQHLLGPANGIGGYLMKPVLLFKVASQFFPFLFRNRVSVVGPRINVFFSALREHETLPVGTAGFCWGGQHAVTLTHAASPGKPAFVKAAFTAHPSGVTVPADIEAMTVPLSIAIGTKDMVLNMKAIGQLQAALDKKTDVPHEIKIYEGAKHGFAVRGNPGDAKENEQATEAEEQAIAWFAKYLVPGMTA